MKSGGKGKTGAGGGRMNRLVHGVETRWRYTRRIW